MINVVGNGPSLHTENRLIRTAYTCIQCWKSDSCDDPTAVSVSAVQRWLTEREYWMSSGLHREAQYLRYSCSANDARTGDGKNAHWNSVLA